MKRKGLFFCSVVVACALVLGVRSLNVEDAQAADPVATKALAQNLAPVPAVQSAPRTSPRDSPGTVASGPSIIVVDFDTLRADRVGRTPNSITPNLDRFASQAVVFEEAYSNSNETLFSHASLFTGRYASEVGSLSYDFLLPEDVPTLASLLRDAGYQTFGAFAGGHLREDYGFGSGFQKVSQAMDWSSLMTTRGTASKWLKERASNAPVFLWLHGYDTHQRYLKPTPFGYLFSELSRSGTVREIVSRQNGFREVLDGYFLPDVDFNEAIDWTALRPIGTGPGDRALTELGKSKHNDSVSIVERVALTEEDIVHLRGIYDGAVAYADLQFGLWMAVLEQEGLLDSSIVVVLSDHGEELGERGLFGHRHDLSDETLRVPLMVRPPGGLSQTFRVDEQVSLIDVMPSLLEAAGVEAPKEARGTSFWGAVSRQEQVVERPIFAESNMRAVRVRAPDGALNFTGIAADSPYWLPTVKNTRTSTLAYQASDGLSKARQAELRKALIQWREGLTIAPPTQRTSAPSDLKRALKEKGYWETK